MISQWLKVEGLLFDRDDIPSVLIPRGLLLNGGTGTGKTLGSKVIAKKLGINLYRLDLGQLLNMYIGNSEANLARALSYIERMAPCALLIDECEKLFGIDDESGVMGRLLGALLWWMQEHKSRVLMLMTTNDMDAIPEELFRPGRIDYSLEFTGIKSTKIPKFVKGLLASLQLSDILNEEQIKEIQTSVVESGVATQAAVTQEVYRAVKIALITQ